MRSLPQSASAQSEHASPANRPATDSGGEQFQPGVHRPPGRAGPDPDDLRIAVLVRAIEHEVIPRLMLAHRTAGECLALASEGSKHVTADDVEQFTQFILLQDETLAHACIQAIRTRGVPVETIYLELLAPVARRLGTMWEDDLCDFTDVTLGLGRLHQVLQDLSSSSEPPIRASNGRRILLLPSPGEQHTFGLVMVGEMFRRAGWEVEGGPSEHAINPVARGKDTWFDIVGFSLAADVHLGALTQCIQSLRQATLNRSVGIMVGGPLFNRQPELVAQVGADATVGNGRDAPAAAEALVARLTRDAGTGAGGPS